MPLSIRALCALPWLFVPFTASAAPASTDASSLDEVVVTAQLRDRRLESLPASATVLDAHTLESAGVQHFQDVLNLVPARLMLGRAVLVYFPFTRVGRIR